MKKCKILILLIVLVVTNFCVGENAPSIFTWVHWKEQGGKQWKVESSVKSPKVQLYCVKSGQKIVNQKDLRLAGWNLDGKDFLVSPPQKGGERIRINVSGLPIGRHDVFLRLFARPRRPGESWWYITHANVGKRKKEGGGINMRSLYLNGVPQKNNSIIVAGTGGYDENTIYEVKLGSVGTDKKPVAEVNLWFERYKWSQMSKIGSIRIETTLNTDYSQTSINSPGNQRFKKLFMDNATSNNAGEKIFGVKTISAAVKVRPKSFKSLEDQVLQDDLNISAAKGEYENRQILLFSPNNDFKVSWEISELRDSAGHVIPIKNQMIAPVGYVLCPNADLEINGWWPDPILTFMKDCNVKKHDVQSLWYRLYVPDNTPAGVYRGQILLKSTNVKDKLIPVELRVRDIKLEKMSKLRFIASHDDKYWDFDIKYKVNPSSIYGFNPAWEQLFPKWKKQQVTAINLAYIWKKMIKQKNKLPTDKQLKEWVLLIRKRLDSAKKAGIADKCYVYLFDEGKADWHPALRKISSTLRKEFPDLTLLTTAQMPWTGKESIDSINAWCPNIRRYDIQKADEARKAGKEIWTYVCNTPLKPYPNLFVAGSTAMDHRMLLGFIAGAFRFDGFLYFAFQKGWARKRTNPMKEVGPYTTWIMTGDGDGQMYQYTKNGPLPSIRMENMRDGLEDYDYIFYAREKIEKGKLSNEALKLKSDVQKLLMPGSSFITSLTKYSQSPEQLEKKRMLLVDFLEK